MLHLNNAHVSDLKEIGAFEKRALKIVPRLSSLLIPSNEWLALLNRYEKQGIKRLTSEFVLRNLSYIKKIPYEQLVASLNVKSLHREAKPVFVREPIAKRAFFGRGIVGDGSNPLVLEDSPESDLLASPIKRTGARVCALDDASPERGYHQLKKTPGGSKVHPIFRNENGGLFKPLTPYGKNNKSMVDLERVTQEKLESELPLFEPPKTVRFIATLSKLEERRGVKRSIGQNALMKVSCREVFIAHGIDTFITIHGSEYHWSHLIAHFLGGEQSEDNLVAGTASSNYNTLDLVEKHIAEKLIKKHALSIDIEVEPIFGGASRIPNELVFKLKWQELGKDYLEIININPRSYQRFTKAMFKSFDCMREEDSKATPCSM